MTSTLTIEDQEKFRNDISALKSTLIEVLEFSKDNLIMFDATTVENYAWYLLDIFARFRLNIEGLLNLMDSFYEDFRLKVCVNLILRAICSDILTALYLATFYDKEDPELVGLKNELDLLHSEFLKSIKQTIEEEHIFLDFFKTNQETTLEEKKEWFNKVATELLDENGKFKTKKKIRETTNPKIKLGLTDSGSFLTEIEKFNRIKDKGYGQFGFVFIGFKYYSQFQHFSQASKSLIENNPLRDTFFMSLTLDNMLMTVDIILQIARTPKKNSQKEIKTIREKLAKHFA